MLVSGGKGCLGINISVRFNGPIGRMITYEEAEAYSAMWLSENIGHGCRVRPSRLRETFVLALMYPMGWWLTLWPKSELELAVIYGKHFSHKLPLSLELHQAWSIVFCTEYHKSLACAFGPSLSRRMAFSSLEMTSLCLSISIMMFPPYVLSKRGVWPINLTLW